MKNGRYSSSVALSILAYEEISKADEIRLKIKDGKSLSEDEWDKMSFGIEAHKIKLSGVIERREKRLNALSQRQADFLNAVNNTLGFSGTIDLELSKEQAKSLKTIFPKLNLVKQDCLYLNFDKKNKQWSYFDKRFKENEKKAIAYCLIMETKRLLLLQKWISNFPNKPFLQYTDEERKWVKNLDNKELRKVVEEINTTEYRKLNSIATSAIDSYHFEVKK